MKQSNRRKSWQSPSPLKNLTVYESKSHLNYPVSAWGKKGTLLRDSIEQIIKYAQAPESMVGQCTLGALSTIAQAVVDAPFALGNYYMPTSIFSLIEGESGGGKSRVTRITHKSIVQYQREQTNIRKKWATELNNTAEKERNEWKVNNPEPFCDTVIVKSGTLQGFLDKFLLGDTKNLSWSTSDGAQFFNGHSMKSDTASANIACICDIWSEGAFDRLLSLRGADIDEFSADDIRLGIDIQAQPSVVTEALSNSDFDNIGLLPRFLFAFPPSNMGQIVYNTDEQLHAIHERDPTLLKFWERCDELLLMRTEYLIKERYKMRFKDFEARKCLADYQTEVEFELKEGGRYVNYSSYARRLAENASRIATIIALFNDKHSISAGDIRRASLLTNFSISERMKYFYKDETVESDIEKLQRWIVDRYRKLNVDVLAYADIQSKVSTRSLRKKANFELAIESLIAKNHINVYFDGNARYIELNPALL